MELVDVKRRRKRLSKKNRVAVIERDGRTCKVCGKQNLVLYQEILDFVKENGLEELPKDMMDREAEIDHIIPFSEGGECNLDNFQILCRSCNNSKGSKSMDEFIEYRKRKGLEVIE